MTGTNYDVWRKCWEDYLLGSQLNPDGVYERQIVDSIDRMASLELDFQGYGDESECTVSSPIFGLRARAMAYRTRGSRYYQDQEVLRGVIKGLEDFYDQQYNMSTAPDKIENWWLFEIGAPLRILDILVLLYDELGSTEHRQELIRRYTDVILYFRDAYKTSSHGKPETGANLMWKCHIHLLTGILRKEPEWIDWANKQLPSLLGFSHSIQVPGIGTMYDDGFYEDGSFIQHYMFAYTGGYGKHFLSILSGMLFAFRGQECLQLPKENLEFLFRMVKEAYLPLLYKGHMMDVCRGREPSRYWCQDQDAGSLILRALLYLCEALPEAEREELEGCLKEQLSLPDGRIRILYDFHPSAEYYVTPSLAERLHALDESTVPAAALQTGHYNFGVMCKPVHRTARYAFAVSMYSKNIACYEKLNLECNKFWHISDGATYLYAGEGRTYSGDYYATADMQRLAGTTVERNANRAADPYYSWYLPEARNAYAFAGGATLENTGIAGMQYRGQGNGKERTLEVKKSWFMFENEIVCLGSGISSITDNPVETIIFNDRLTEGKNGFRVYGTDGEIALKLGEEIVVRTDRIYLQQVPTVDDKKQLQTFAPEEETHQQALAAETCDGCGYLFPDGVTIHLLLEKRKGTWNSTVLNPKHVSENVHLTGWISHETHPEHDTYAYVILPACSRQEWEKEAADPSFRIEENTEYAHAVRSLKENTLGINFWTEQPYVSTGIECSTQASLLLHQDANGANDSRKQDTEDARITVAVSDPTKQNRQISLRSVNGLAFDIMADTQGADGKALLFQITG